MANVVFLWHMHQPYYVDPTTQVALMPWVRLHCVKGYLDMVSVLEEFPGIRVNFNLTPVLLLQIRELTDGKIQDAWLNWSRKPAAELTEDEKFLLLENFFKINWDNLLFPFPRYRELLNKRGLTFYRDEVRRGLRYFSTQEFLDLQVWFNLAWCGYTAGRLFPELEALKRKGRSFTEEEKHRVLDLHLEMMRLVIQKYRAAEERGQAELTTTPFFHPILPLVFDSSLAGRSLPGRDLPQRFHWPEDAEAQLRLAVDQHAFLFGRTPRGLWPSEGSVAPELIPIIRQCGFEYFCSDEGNLFQSLPTEAGTPKDRLQLFQGWQVSHEGATVSALFREQTLSDFIGFVAARNPAQTAAAQLLNYMVEIARLLPLDTGVIPLILDGENAWETFPDGGESFLRELYGGIEERRELLHSCTIEDFFRHHTPTHEIARLHTGSWIGSNFDMWIGEEDENRAWEMLGQARHHLQEKSAQGLSATVRCAALREIYAAQGSDWFWWYGPDFSTENDALFDRLFRQHLQSVYTLCGDLPPPELDSPVTRSNSVALFTVPTILISPHVDGKQGTFFEWAGAGRYLPDRQLEQWKRPSRVIRSIDFGHDEKFLYFRLDLVRWVPLTLAIDFLQPSPALLISELTTQKATLEYSLQRAGETLTASTISAEDSIEIAIELSSLAAKPGQKCSFRVFVHSAPLPAERHPENVPLEFILLDENSALANWSV